MRNFFLVILAYLLLYTINPDLVSPQGVQSSNSTTSPVYGGGGASGALNGIPSQVANQNDDASQLLLDTLNCMWGKVPEGKSFTISSISDNNCGVGGYAGERANWPQCSREGQTNCCYHKRNSCHYGGTNCRGNHKKSANTNNPNSKLINPSHISVEGITFSSSSEARNTFQ